MATIYRPALWEPSYDQGFARDASEAANPNLWDRLAFNWHGPLGITGIGTDSIRDTAGRSLHGTPSGMDASDWVATEKGWGLELDGSNDHIEIAAAIVALGSPDTMTFAIFANLTNWIAGFDYIVDATDGSVGFGIRRTSATSLLAFVYREGATRTVIAAYTEDVWASYVFRMTPTGQQVFIDGIQVGSNTDTGPMDAATQLNIGADFRGSSNSAMQFTSAALWSRDLAFNEIQQLAFDEHAIVRPRRAVPLSVAAPAGNRRRRMIFFGAGT